MQSPRPLSRGVVYYPYDTSRKKQSQKTAPRGPVEYVVELVTNNCKWDAETISGLYLASWRIEPFFKLIKQNLRIKTFVGTDKNAVHTQIRTVMIAICCYSTFATAPATIGICPTRLTFIRIHLMSHIDLWIWLNRMETSGGAPP